MTKPAIAISGGTGFVGRHLLQSLLRQRNVQVRLLVHRSAPTELASQQNVQVVMGDLLDRQSLERWIQPGDAVVNLAYLTGARPEDNFQAAENLAAACVQSGAARLIHCSTAAVVGRAAAAVIDERVDCRPGNEYECTKLTIEQTLRNQCGVHSPLVVLRPTAVFGPGGRNLVKLADTVFRGQSLSRYVRSSVHGDRRMNAVGVDNVVGAIEFVLHTGARLNGEILIVSDDEFPENNYREIERFLQQHLARPAGALPLFPVPRSVLAGLLRLAGRSAVNPDRIYDGGKLSRAGFVKRCTLADSLMRFGDWYRQQAIANQSGRRAA